MSEPSPVGSSNPQLQLLQANERTVLAWVRTGLAIMAFGFVVARIGLWLRQMNPSGQHAAGHSLWIGAGFIALGMLTHLIAAQRYVLARNAILEHRTVLPGSTTILFVTFSLTILGGVLLAYLLTQ